MMKGMTDGAGADHDNEDAQQQPRAPVSNSEQAAIAAHAREQNASGGTGDPARVEIAEAGAGAVINDLVPWGYFKQVGQIDSDMGELAGGMDEFACVIDTLYAGVIQMGPDAWANLNNVIMWGDELEQTIQTDSNEYVRTKTANALSTLVQVASIPPFSVTEYDVARAVTATHWLAHTYEWWHKGGDENPTVGKTVGAKLRGLLWQGGSPRHEGKLVQVVRYWDEDDNGKPFAHVCLAVDNGGGTYTQVYNGYPDSQGNILTSITIGPLRETISPRPTITHNDDSKDNSYGDGKPFGYD